MSDLLSIILAAGEGTRMKSDKIKILHPVAGKAIIKHVLNTLDGLNSKIVNVIGYQKNEVQAELEDLDKWDLNYVIQSEQLGTGHAVLQAEKYIEKHEGPVLILYGDTPLLKKESIAEFVKEHEESRSDLTVMTAVFDNPEGYGRIVKDKDGNLSAIVEEKDADFETKKIKEINSGVNCIDSKLLKDFLSNMDNDNAQGEYYLTDIIEYAVKKNKKINTYVVENSNEIIGINTRKQQAEAEKILRSRIIDQHLTNGVTIIDPDTTFIDSEVEIAQDVTIYPFNYLEGRTKIGANTVINQNCKLKDAVIADNVNIRSNTVIKDSKVGSNTNVGPFAYLRPGSAVEDNCKIGDFVELKKTTVKSGAKVPHLCYAGDAEIGEGTNIGAGTIFANYDGQKKSRTIIGKDAFIGSDSILIAPLTIGDGAKTAAGSVVTKNINPGDTVMGVPARIYKSKNKET
ncbi:bifunctional UDP-N-acetylglucosamine pyrophosphorylase / Glucosamine-1-phosphate N-acetyltransferase [Halanaerobium congolense]|jgi:bifunctional UDP-N-acetylglucosamine pyrophosphorylase/glucosamine-1-phosphate N-acetyltransferase|uniref:Bifunctional protein GlmU n=1 Tax=Halanaerobium congolense TaxID=54121 RepID=A0A4R7E5G3_9FIRM|nr:bifunctional UDP-N-acetylglucosamine diphosphorylase/glucosamine-1-phosphate N-acetyltransferase GlmU [Halanaerobium congolense]OEG63574.1 MAG: UDP-N-acetylglucosamine diphosphorylase/glucosamine-1-phosphate N-acetyltransferase [Halanaerobium sp. MDAL1]PTX15641.1 bifunctional UDP-N-acetylglucosamine pyrophosphorylase/glucosamine-1-phosphate N-acetyltransferase [Halanaerobium congolense]TDP09417.1 bifunctional UDP-N-acetylglucosamine pyrophosphorylase/glucosamine-1-phosphate N-acetyltransferas